jgi:hypothetical protein
MQRSDPYPRPLSLMEGRPSGLAPAPGMARFLLIVPGMALILAYAVALSPLFLFLSVRSWIDKRQEAKFLARMRERSRLLTFAAITNRADQENGTILVERRGHGRMTRHWWTPENLSACSPYPIPAPAEPMSKQSEAFVTWAYRRYCDPERGTAFLLAVSWEELWEFFRRVEGLPRVYVKRRGSISCT